MIVRVLGGELIKHEVLAFAIILQGSECFNNSEPKALQVCTTKEVLAQDLVAQSPIPGLCKAGHVGPGTLLPEKVMENFPHCRHATHKHGSQMDASVGTPMRSREANGRSCGHFLVVGAVNTVHVIDRGVRVAVRGV